MSENEFDDFPELTEEQLAASDHFIRGTEHPLMIQAKEKLKKVFEYDAFQLKQEQAIECLLVKRKNALVLFPTGGGKSLVFQIPALCLPGLTIVVSPLISLMKDQVDVLRRKGVAAASLDSSLTAEETIKVNDDVRDGTLKLLYVAPERLNNERFHELIRGSKVSLLAVDESHCISEWGSSFRPDYLKVARFAEEIKAERVLCLTATATPTVADDICKAFSIDRSGVFKTPVFRPNLVFNVLQAHSLDDKIRQIVPHLKTRAGSAILYVTLQAQCEQVVTLLARSGIVASGYHAGMSADARKKNQDAFMASKDSVMVATIAFAMGVDKANIRIIAHLFFSKALESYSQEVGRAGRDGQVSQCFLLLHNPDIPVLEGFVRGDTCSKESVVQWLQALGDLKEDIGDPQVISTNNYQQCIDYDIRPTMLGIMYAQLELDYGYIRALTPAYANYEIKPKTEAGWKAILTETYPEAKAIQRGMVTKKLWTSVDLYDVAKTSGIAREFIQRKLNSWEIQGFIEIKVSGVRSRYLLNKKMPLPTDDEGIDELASKIHGLSMQREARDIARLHQCVEMATAAQCIAKTLSQHFGDVVSTPTETCTTCTFCRTGQATTFPYPLALDGASPLPSESKVNAVLSAVPPRDDPLLLTRFAFGISSPRLTMLKLGKHPAFGSMVDMPFETLLKTFEKACEDHPRVRPMPGSETLLTAPRGGVGFGRGAGSSGSGSSRSKKDGGADDSKGKPYRRPRSGGNGSWRGHA